MDEKRNCCESKISIYIHFFSRHLTNPVVVQVQICAFCAVLRSINAEKWKYDAIAWIWTWTFEHASLFWLICVRVPAIDEFCARSLTHCPLSLSLVSTENTNIHTKYLFFCVCSFSRYVCETALNCWLNAGMVFCRMKSRQLVSCESANAFVHSVKWARMSVLRWNGTIPFQWICRRSIRREVRVAILSSIHLLKITTCNEPPTKSDYILSDHNCNRLLVYSFSCYIVWTQMAVLEHGGVHLINYSRQIFGMANFFWRMMLR